MEYLLVFILDYSPFAALTERIEYALPRAYIDSGSFDLLCDPVQSVYFFAYIILDFRFLQFVNFANRIPIKFKVVFFLSEYKFVVEIIDIVISIAFVIFVKAPAYMTVFHALSKHRYFLTAFHIFPHKKQLPHIQHGSFIFTKAVSLILSQPTFIFKSLPLSF